MQPIKQFLMRPAVKRSRRRYEKIFSSHSFGRWYGAVGLGSLLLTTLLWTIIGARLQAVNADQLVDPYLFNDGATFKGANFPAAHSFLLKWPLFYLIKLFHYAPAAYYGVTVVVVLATVGWLAWLLHKMDRRPLVFGSLCLALALVLLLIPAQPYAGALLPTNMAMLATRNIEYVLYLASLLSLSRLPAIRSWRFVIAVGGLALLIASDKLFLTLTLASAALLLPYALVQRWKLVSLSVSWLVASVVAASLAFGGLYIMNATQLTNIFSESSSASPYGLVHNFHDIALGGIYAVLGLLTNFGANPISNPTLLSQLPSGALRGLTGYGGLGYLVNGATLIIFGIFSFKTIINSLARRQRAFDRSHYNFFSLMLLANTAVAFGLFIAAKHYYAVDSRYVTISLFAGFVIAANYARTIKIVPATRLALAGGLMIVAMLGALPHVFATQTDGLTALQSVPRRSRVINQALRQHKVQVLVGDYWRVLPAKAMTPKTTSILPLSNCTQPRLSLTSQVWQADLKQSSFAYLLTLDRSLTDYPSCSFKQVVASYGQPNSTALIAGSNDHPKELLLFYDHGTRSQGPTPVVRAEAAAIHPTDISDLPVGSCVNPTILNIVAHQDDDLLFMNPDTQHSLDAGSCVRTIYLTAGDSGYDRFYWTKRQQGVEAAYSKMLNSSNAWLQQIVKLAPGRYVTIASLVGHKNVSLLFVNLPDGNIKGDGFSGSHHESLAKLEAGSIDRIRSVDDQSSFTSTQLADDLGRLMQLYQPAEIRTLADEPSQQYPDHSDHMASKHFAQKARLRYQHQQFNDAVEIPIKFYVGYPVHAFAPNVEGEDFNRKEVVFLTYAQFDGGVCSTESMCKQTPTYGSYLSRQYQQ